MSSGFNGTKTMSDGSTRTYVDGLVTYIRYPAGTQPKDIILPKVINENEGRLIEEPSPTTTPYTPTYAELVQMYGKAGYGPPPEEILREIYASEVAARRAGQEIAVGRAAGTGGQVYDPNAAGFGGDDVNQNITANYVQGTGFAVYDPNAPISNRAAFPYEGEGLPTYEDYISQEETFTDSDVDTEEPYTPTQEPYTPTQEPYTPTQEPYKPTTVPDEGDTDDDTEDDEVPSLPGSNTPSGRKPPQKPDSDPDPFYITYRVPIIILSVLLIIGLILYFYYKNKRSTNLNKPIKQVLASFGKMFNR